MLKFVSKIAAFEGISEELSQDLNNFDLVNLDEKERRCMERQWNAFVGDSDDDEDDFEGFEPEELYVPHVFFFDEFFFLMKGKSKEICFSFLTELGTPEC
ncbi:hypothetical protein CHS0354_012043 [Potamilus streckersoni]|uniref:Uncharacterized protein n=1 Tax=Potamilus streckersoni TaxID=2493646 RepID=A0AAE0WG15_9BIVA|nr:hypothetical protein CHS0354_012043 [Potamilus streckersoni]